VRIGFLGAGLIATYHAKSLRASGAEATISAVYDPAEDRAERFAAATGAAVARSEDEVLDHSDAVYVCTWTSEHRRLVEAAAAAGKAVFCEKPLATDLAGAQAMAAAVADAGVTNQVGLVLRASPVFNALAERLADPAVGRIMAVVFRDDQYLPVQGMYGSTWRGEVAKAGAGALLEHSIHDVDLLEWLVGRAETAAAQQANFHGTPGIEDLVVATLGYPGGATASLTSVWHDVLSRPSLRYVEVLCEGAWFAVDSDWSGPLRMMTNEGQAVFETAGLPTPPNPDGAFVAAAREGRSASPDFAVALRAHEVVDALYRSAALGGTPCAVSSGGAG
jgi:predicted dehydrogenase